MLSGLKKYENATDYHDFWAGMTLLTLFVIVMVLYWAGLLVAGVIVAGTVGIPTFFTYEPIRRLVRKYECQSDLQPSKEMLNLLNGD